MKSEKIPFMKKVKLRRRYQWLAKGAQIDLVDHKFELHIWWYNSDHLRTIIRTADYTCPMRNLWAFRESEQGPVTIYYFCEEQKRLCLVAYECDEWVIWRKYVFFRKGRYWNLFKIDSLQYLYLGLWKNGFWCSNSNFLFRKNMLVAYFLFGDELYCKIYRNKKKYRLQEKFAFERFDGLWDYLLDCYQIPDLKQFCGCRVFVEDGTFWKPKDFVEQLKRVRKGKNLSREGKCFVAKGV